jgi:hypothetical protein
MNSFDHYKYQVKFPAPDNSSPLLERYEKLVIFNKWRNNIKDELSRLTILCNYGAIYIDNCLVILTNDLEIYNKLLSIDITKL